MTMMRWGLGLGLMGLVACGKSQHEEAPVVAPSATASARVAAPASATAAPVATTVAQVAHGPGPELDVTGAKVTRGKLTNGQDKAKLNLPPMEKQCLVPAYKKDAGSLGEGTVKMAVDADDQGNVLRVKTTTEGKIPADVASCLAGYVRREFKFDNTEPSAVELTLSVKVHP